MKGKTWQCEWSLITDRKTGVEVRRLTDYLGHSHHLYFTNSSWYDSEKKLLFGSDRDNEKTLCSLDVESGTITRLTGENPPAEPAESHLQFSCINPIKPEAYFWFGFELRAIHLHTLKERVIYEAPHGYRTALQSCTADGKWVCTDITQDKSSSIKMDLLRGYVGFKEYMESHPKSFILKIATDGSGHKVLWEEDCWISHVNTSPVRCDILSFCHEGPWEYIDHRLFGLNLENGEIWKIRPQAEGEFIGHEYWLEDGETLGYHGFRGERQCFFGTTRYDNSQQRESEIPEWHSHFHSNGRELFVSDGHAGKPHIVLWRWDGDKPQARLLCQHGSGMRIQQTHAHPRFTQDGRQILFTSDVNGYGNLYLVTVPEFESLPLLDEQP